MMISSIMHELIDKINMELVDPKNHNYSEYYDYNMRKLLIDYCDKIEAIQRAPVDIEVWSPSYTKSIEWLDLGLIGTTDATADTNKGTAGASAMGNDKRV
jgi:hypothetical protein